jgi:hypothetical protein
MCRVRPCSTCLSYDDTQFPSFWSIGYAHRTVGRKYAEVVSACLPVNGRSKMRADCDAKGSRWAGNRAREFQSYSLLLVVLLIGEIFAP